MGSKKNGSSWWRRPKEEPRDEHHDQMAASLRRWIQRDRARLREELDLPPLPLDPEDEETHGDLPETFGDDHGSPGDLPKTSDEDHGSPAENPPAQPERRRSTGRLYEIFRDRTGGESLEG